MKNKLKEVTEKIYSLLKCSELDPIREADVLMALKSGTQQDYLIGGDCRIYESHYYEIDMGCCEWVLGSTLSEQSEETIDFLHEILGC